MNFLIKILLKIKNYMNQNNQNHNNIILDNLEAQAKKLGVLLVESDIPHEIKEAWLNLLPDMSLEQIDKLLHVLETKFLNDNTGEIDKEFYEKLKVIISEHKEKQDLLDKKLINNIEAFN